MASGVFEIRFDFIDHHLRILTAEGQLEAIPLEPRSVADFYSDVMAAMKDMHLPVKINTVPNEIADAYPVRER